MNFARTRRPNSSSFSANQPRQFCVHHPSTSRIRRIRLYPTQHLGVDDSSYGCSCWGGCALTKRSVCLLSHYICLRGFYTVFDAICSFCNIYYLFRFQRRDAVFWKGSLHDTSKSARKDGRRAESTSTKFVVVCLCGFRVWVCNFAA